MKAVERKIRILYLKENHCGECNYRDKEFQYCIQNCEVGQELNKLYEKGFKKRSKQRKDKEKIWDEKCEYATWLYEKEIEYPVIAKILGCHISSLYRELKKRGDLKNPSNKRLKDSKFYI
ncbi:MULTISPECIES: hypothetical protein [Bacillus]|uniref:hypothetical protein n=1 Tax=Bacillus TaxID=1386 RepID=UPI00077258C1|nr:MULTISPECIES: hypothetical protein [Bacillus]KXH80119.1 hypothetical protein AU379_22745 [Bacillus sp. JH7]